MVLSNYVTLPPNVPRRLQFTGEIGFEDREITDPVTGKLKRIRLMVLGVSRVDNEERDTELSVTSERLATTLNAYSKRAGWEKFGYVITRHGDGFGSSFEVTRLPNESTP